MCFTISLSCRSLSLATSSSTYTSSITWNFNIDCSWSWQPASPFLKSVFVFVTSTFSSSHRTTLFTYCNILLVNASYSWLDLYGKTRSNWTLGNIWEACWDDCKNEIKGFNSFASSFNEASAALRAALQAWTSPVRERSCNDASSLSCMVKHLLIIFWACWITVCTWNKMANATRQWEFSDRNARHLLQQPCLNNLHT